MVGHVAEVVLVSTNEAQAMRNAHTHTQRMFYGGLSWGYVSMGGVFSYAGMNFMAFL